MEPSKGINFYVDLYSKHLPFNNVAWWLIDLENSSDRFYCNATMCDLFDLDTTANTHSVKQTCPIAGDYNKNIAQTCNTTAIKVFNEYQQLVDGKTDHYTNQFPYFDHRDNKTKFYISHATTLEKSQGGTPTIILGLIEQELIAEELYSEARTDCLTKLYNRREFDSQLRFLLNLATREKRFLSLVLCDVDNFKAFNDLYGHLRGDDCLREVSNILKAGCRNKTDLVFRYGGEEFAILSYGDEHSGTMIAERIIEEVATLKIPCSYGAGFVTLSMGCFSICPERDTSAANIVEKADQAMYQAKRNGKNTFVVA